MMSIDLSQHVDPMGSNSRYIFERDVETSAPAPRRMRREGRAYHRQVSGIRLTGVPVTEKQKNADWQLSMTFVRRGSVALFVALLIGSFHEIACAMLLMGAAHGSVSMANRLRGKTLQMEADHAYLRKSMKDIDDELEDAIQGFQAVKAQLRAGQPMTESANDQLDYAFKDFQTVAKHLRAKQAVSNEELARAIQEDHEQELSEDSEIPDFVTLQFE
jgi:hypothetical protein